VLCSNLSKKPLTAAASTPSTVLKHHWRRKVLSSNNNQLEIRPARLSLINQSHASFPSQGQADPGFWSEFQGLYNLMMQWVVSFWHCLAGIF
jgi:hypothetical protein